MSVETEADQPGNGAEPSPPPRTLLDEVRVQLEQDLAEETLDLRLPRRQPRLVARYRVIDPDDVNIGGDFISANVSMLTQACVGLFVLDEEGQLRALEDGGQPVTYATVAQTLGLEVENTRDAILYLFKGNQLAFREHSDKVAGWMGDTSQEVEGEVLGESSA